MAQGLVSVVRKGAGDSWVLPPGVGNAGRQARGRSVMLKCFFQMSLTYERPSFSMKNGGN